jgi:hypothetical protein
VVFFRPANGNDWPSAIALGIHNNNKIAVLDALQLTHMSFSGSLRNIKQCAGGWIFVLNVMCSGMLMFC